MFVVVDSAPLTDSDTNDNDEAMCHRILKELCLRGRNSSGIKSASLAVMKFSVHLPEIRHPKVQTFVVLFMINLCWH